MNAGCGSNPAVGSRTTRVNADWKQSDAGDGPTPLTSSNPGSCQQTAKGCTFQRTDSRPSRDLVSRRNDATYVALAGDAADVFGCRQILSDNSERFIERDLRRTSPTGFLAAQHASDLSFSKSNMTTSPWGY